MKRPTLTAAAIVVGGAVVLGGAGIVAGDLADAAEAQALHDQSVQLTIETFYDSFDPAEQEQVCQSWQRDPEPFWIAFDEASNGATTVDVLDEAMTVVCDASA